MDILSLESVGYKSATKPRDYDVDNSDAVLGGCSRRVALIQDTPVAVQTLKLHGSAKRFVEADWASWESTPE